MSRLLACLLAVGTFAALAAPKPAAAVGWTVDISYVREYSPGAYIIEGNYTVTDAQFNDGSVLSVTVWAVKVDDAEFETAGVNLNCIVIPAPNTNHGTFVALSSFTGIAGGINCMPSISMGGTCRAVGEVSYGQPTLFYDTQWTPIWDTYTRCAVYKGLDSNNDVYASVWWEPTEKMIYAGGRVFTDGSTVNMKVKRHSDGTVIGSNLAIFKSGSKEWVASVFSTALANETNVDVYFECYDPATEQWYNCGPVNVSRSGQSGAYGRIPE